MTYFLGVNHTSLTNDVNLKFPNNNVINLNDQESEFYNSSPIEFLNLLLNCDKFFTNSFHGAVFALIFGIEVMVIEREVVNKSYDDRIFSLFRLLNIDSNYIYKLVETNNRFLKYNSELMEKIIIDNKIKVLNFLNSVFNGNSK